MILSSACIRMILLAGQASAIPADSATARPAILPQLHLRKGFALFRRIYEKTDSGLYTNLIHRRIDSAFAASRALIAPQTTLIEFYQLIYSVTKYTGSLPSDNYLPSRIDPL